MYLTSFVVFLGGCTCGGDACDDSGRTKETGTPDAEGADVPGSTAVDESERTGGGGAGDFGTPDWSVELDHAPWISQVFTCDWSSTKTCGPTSLAMARAAVEPDLVLDDDLVRGFVEALGQSWPCGGYTGIDDLESLASASGMEVAEYYFDAGLLVDALDAGHPVIAPVWTQDTSDGTMDEVSRYGHFVEIVGVTSTSVIANDPGRSSATNGERHSYALEDFLTAWYANGRYIGLEVKAPGDDHEVDAEVDCDVEGSTLRVSGTIGADANFEKVSVTVDSSGALWSDETLSTSYEIDAEVDVGDYADGATHTAGIWIRFDGESDGVKVAECDFVAEPAEECPDRDGDGHRDEACGGDDCDDEDAGAYPDAPERCDEVDNDCDGAVDDDTSPADWYLDADGDGYGDASVVVSSCEEPAGYADNDGDCDDGDATTHPGSAEPECEVDHDCDGSLEPVDSCFVAVDLSSYPTDCGSSDQDVLTITGATVDNSVSPPTATLTLAKCDSSALAESHSCDIRVGGASDIAVSRLTLTWAGGSSSATATVSIWPSAAEWSAAAVGEQKDLYVTCDEGDVEAWWIGSGPATFEKQLR